MAAARGSRRASVRSSASPRSRRTRGSSSGSPIDAVFRSWESDRARAYRQKEGIPDDLGTAVTVQAMVFGNRGDTSGTGVLFTRNPATGEPEPYGDVLFDAQGEDVVAGTHRDGADRGARGAAARRRRGAAGHRRAAGAPLRGPLRHRVHHRVGPAVDAPGPGRQAQPAGGAPDRRRHGRGPRVPAHPGRGGRPGSRRSLPTRRRVRARAATCCSPWSPASPHRLARPADRWRRPPRRRRRPRPRARPRSSSGPRRRPTTCTAWPCRPAS